MARKNSKIELFDDEIDSAGKKIKLLRRNLNWEPFDKVANALPRTYKIETE